MHCRDATPLISAARDGALSSTQRAELDGHLTECAACRQFQAELTAAMASYQADATQVTVPDADEEWHLLRTQLSTPARKRRVAPITWIAMPLAAAAAVALAFFIGRPAAPTQPTLAAPTAELAHADFVEVVDGEATPLVYVDKESGWLVVWAVENESPVVTS